MAILDERFFLAACLQNDSEIRECLSMGVNPNLRNEMGSTALILVAVGVSSESVVCLIQNGAMIDCRNNKGYTALHAAAELGSIEVVKTLVNHGANIFTKTFNGHTPREIAKSCNRLDIASYLEVEEMGRLFRR